MSISRLKHIMELHVTTIFILVETYKQTKKSVEQHLHMMQVHSRPCVCMAGHCYSIFSERELMFMFAICRRPSVCLSVVCLSVVCLSVCRLSSVTFVHPTQPIEIFGNVSAPCNTLVT